MSLENTLIWAAFFLSGALFTFAIRVPRGRMWGHSPPPDEGWEPPERIQMPPPKVYPEGQAPRRARPGMGCPCDAEEPEWCRTHGDSPTAKSWPVIRVCDCDCGHPEQCETHPRRDDP